jgi:hypothetical protein
MLFPLTREEGLHLHQSLPPGSPDYPTPPSYPADRRGSAGEVVGLVRPGDWPYRARLAHVAGGRGRYGETQTDFLQPLNKDYKSKILCLNRQGMKHINVLLYG